MYFRNLTLEMSLKPFKDPSDEAVRTVARKLFTQWLPLARHSAQLSVMLWAGENLLSILNLGCETELIDGRATYHQPRAWRRECRLFVEQESGLIGLREFHPSTSHGIRRRFLLSGLDHAPLRFFHVPGSENNVTMLRQPTWPYVEGGVITKR